MNSLPPNPDSVFQRQVSHRLEALTNLLYLAKLAAKDGTDCERYLTLAQEQTVDLVSLFTSDYRQNSRQREG
jgi:hypothetical protein